jgi:hypothetical protein
METRGHFVDRSRGIRVDGEAEGKEICDFLASLTVCMLLADMYPKARDVPTHSHAIRRMLAQVSRHNTLLPLKVLS